MRTTIEIDDDLMAEAQKASRQVTKKQTVEHALRLLIRCNGNTRSAPLLAAIAGAATSQ
jgi:Arc/MetJ family transcription regulator